MELMAKHGDTSRSKSKIVKVKRSRNSSGSVIKMKFGLRREGAGSVLCPIFVCGVEDVNKLDNCCIFYEADLLNQQHSASWAY